MKPNDMRLLPIAGILFLGACTSEVTETSVSPSGEPAAPATEGSGVSEPESEAGPPAEPPATPDSGESSPTTWRREALALGPLTRVWARSATDIFVGGGSSTYHSTGNGVWTPRVVPFVTGEYPTAIWGTADGNTFVLGDRGTVCHATGSGAWTKEDQLGASGGWTGLWGSAADDVYAVGFDSQGHGQVRHRDASGTWELESVPAGARELQAVWGNAANDVYAVGSGGQIWHSIGNGSWTSMTSGVVDTLGAVWGSGSSDVYAAGKKGTVLHYDGKAWKPYASASNDEVLAIWGSGPTDVYMTTDAALVHTTGNGTWTVVLDEVDSTKGYTSIRQVHGVSKSKVFVLGNAGTTEHLIIGE